MKSKPAKDCSVVLVKTKPETKKRIIRVANAVRTEFKDNLAVSPKLNKHSDHYQSTVYNDHGIKSRIDDGKRVWK